MENQVYLIFELNDLRYGIEIPQVREIFELPELTPMADAPGDIIGILDYRGTVLPIMHLAKRLGQDSPPCQLSDSIIVIEWQGLKVGMVVNQVHDVQSFANSSIEPVPTHELRQHTHTAFATGIAKTSDTLITLLNPETLIRQTDEVAMMAWEAELNDLDQDASAYPQEQIFEVSSGPVLTSFFSLYCPKATAAERRVFRQRASNLKISLDSSDASDLMALAVIGLGEEYFGVELQQVREFINTRHVMPIPCCPNHILGNMNLRGEVMTLIDIRKALNLPESDSKTTKAVIIEADDIVAGITVDQVLDVIYLPPSDISAMPAAVPKHFQGFFQGVTHYYQKTLSILDLSKLLSQGDLVVDQTT
ncbi:chemotaxis protein CheW [Leptothoe sp. PORK10 BA2]|uniref:chemotaxis protein CheW n=1 Tax=Leptothoe sp. PORK10 BA2 TaxID=3110254 RepID=UPI002B1F3248|nr:chemotaxis protein CheW [Leptothoe sp. PORK10 BA2]MEA5462519.1 chemotaxis protein CheW [Leptothoe sp. PORK10 BA2]